MILPASLAFELPPWLRAWAASLPDAVSDDESAMGVAIEASRRNVTQGSGGPFGALVIDASNGEPLGLGVNLVVSASTSVLHAEMVALLVAQQASGSHDVSLGGSRPVVLYSSAEPCAMCMGAIPWGGIRRLVCGARDEDVRAIGFDEGDKPADWTAAYARRGIPVLRDVRRREACRVLRTYADAGGPLY